MSEEQELSRKIESKSHLRRHPGAVRCFEQGCRHAVTKWDEFVDVGSQTIHTIYACGDHATEAGKRIKRWKQMPVVSTMENPNQMTDATKYPIQVGNTVEAHPLPGSRTPSGQGNVTRLDPDNHLVFVQFDGAADDFGCLPAELVVVVTA